MTFVKVVGGREIYNFRIQRFVHLYSKNGDFQFQKQVHGHGVGRSAAAPRRCARSSAACRAPLGICARGHRRPRQPTVPGRAPSPCRRRSRDASTALHHTPPRRRGPAVRMPAEERRSTVASRPSSSHRHRRSFAWPIKGVRLLLAPVPPLHRAAMPAV
jgi:hypothetical protein